VGRSWFGATRLLRRLAARKRDRDEETVQMDTPSSEHPSGESLRSFVVGELDEVTAMGVTEHLDNCTECQKSVSEIFGVRLADVIPSGDKAATEGTQHSPDPIVKNGGTTIERLAMEPTDLSAQSAAGGFSQTFRANVRHRALLRGSERSERFQVGGGGVIGRDARSVQYHLDHPHVSRRHAGLTVDGRRVVIADLESSNGTFVNGRQITRPTTWKLSA